MYITEIFHFYIQKYIQDMWNTREEYSLFYYIFDILRKECMLTLLCLFKQMFQEKRSLFRQVKLLYKHWNFLINFLLVSVTFNVL